MNPYYLTDSLGYSFQNGYSSGSGTSSPAPLGVSGMVGGTGQASSGRNGPSAGVSQPQASASSSTQHQPQQQQQQQQQPQQPQQQPPSITSGPLVHPHQDLTEFLETFWTRQMDGVERETPDFKTYNLPLARIKKVMKSDEEVKMISAEAPIMFSKACEIFISELTCRAWLVAEGHKRRTLQKSDVAAAIAFSDVFDFLIDIVPRDGEEQASSNSNSNTVAPPGQSGSNPPSTTGSAGQGNTGSSAPPAAHPHSHQQHHHAHAQHFDDETQWQQQQQDGDDVYDNYEEREGEALYSEYVEGEAFA